MSGRDTLKERSTKPVKVAESDIDVSISATASETLVLFWPFVGTANCLHLLFSLG